MTVGDLQRLFGAAVKHQRSELGMSQEELAERAGLHRTYVSDVERGSRNLSLKSIEKLATALKLSISGLFYEAGLEHERAGSLEILLVEDNPADIELTQRAFQRARFTNLIHVVHDGAEALEFLAGKGRYTHRRGTPLPGIILLDLDLPEIGGVEVLRRIKADERTRDIPVIVLTDSRDYRDAEECQRLGMETYLVKPVDFGHFSQLTPRFHFAWTLSKPWSEEETSP